MRKRKTKNYLWKTGILLLLIPLFLWNCQEDDTTMTIEKQEINTVKSWFNQNKGMTIDQIPLLNSDLDWDKSTVIDNQIYVPINNLNSSIFKKNQSSKNNKYKVYSYSIFDLTKDNISLKFKIYISDFKLQVTNADEFLKLLNLIYIQNNKSNKKKQNNTSHKSDESPEPACETYGVYENVYDPNTGITESTLLYTFELCLNEDGWNPGDGDGGTGTSGGGGTGSNSIVYDESLVYYDDGDKPIYENENKCNGLNQLWTYSQNSGDEYAAVLTADGAILITQQLNTASGGISGIYEFNGITYYQYPTSQGAPSRTYQGQLESVGRYFIPIVATIHSHTPCLNDGTDGITNNTINDDQNFASHYPNINHYIIGCNAIGEFNGNSNQAFNIQTGNLSSTCNNIN